MDKRSMILGAGFGVIIVTFVFFIAIQFNKPSVEIQTLTEAMSDEQVIEQARKLGMVMVKELPSASEQTVTGESVAKEEYDNLKKDIAELLDKLGVAEYKLQVSEEELAAANEALKERSESSLSGNQTAQLPTSTTQAPQVSPAPATQTTPTSSPAATSPSASVQVPTVSTTPEQSAQAPPITPPVYSVGASTDMGDFIRITIPSGGNSISISSLLSNSGVVDDAADFNVYVMENNKSTVLIAGTYDIPKDAEYDEVLEIITRANAVEP